MNLCPDCGEVLYDCDCIFWCQHCSNDEEYCKCFYCQDCGQHEYECGCDDDWDDFGYFEIL